MLVQELRTERARLQKRLAAIDTLLDGYGSAPRRGRKPVRKASRSSSKRAPRGQNVVAVLKALAAGQSSGSGIAKRTGIEARAVNKTFLRQHKIKRVAKRKGGGWKITATGKTYLKDNG